MSPLFIFINKRSFVLLYCLGSFWKSSKKLLPSVISGWFWSVKGVQCRNWCLSHVARSSSNIIRCQYQNKYMIKDLYKYDTDTTIQVGTISTWRNCGTMNKTCLTEFVSSNNAELGMLDYGKSHNHDNFGQYWNHDYFCVWKHIVFLQHVSPKKNVVTENFEISP